MYFMNKKFFITISVLFLVSFLFPEVTMADMWGSNYAATAMKTAQEQIAKQTQDALVAALKVEASQMLVDTVNNLVSGANQAGSLFITDWSNYLFGEPANKTKVAMNDFFTLTTRGKTTGNYIPACGFNFSEWRTAKARNNYSATLDLSEWQTDFEEFACGYQDMFSNESWEGYVKAMEPKNNPIAYNLFAGEVENDIKKKEEQKALAQAEAYGGFKAKIDETGTVITPGSFIRDITTAANKINIDMLSNAHSVGEMAGVVVGQVVSKAIKVGIGSVRREAQARINNNICQASQSLRDGLKNLTPDGTLFDSLGIGSFGKTRDSRCILQ